MSGVMNKTTVNAALGALTQDTRLDIFRLLVERGPGGMAVEKSASGSNSRRRDCPFI
jgi:hypothetical protein